MNIVTLIGSVSTPIREHVGDGESFAVVEVELEGEHGLERYPVVARGAIAQQLLARTPSTTLAVDGRLAFDVALDRVVVEAEHALWIDHVGASRR